MATSGPTALPSFFNTDTDFRNWGNGIHTGLSAAGLVVTADTGQVNWTTVTKPGAINTSQGYEIWKLNDGGSFATVFYFKIEYGSAGATDRPSLWVTVGTGSNGSGTLTGQTLSRAQIGAGASKIAGGTLNAYFSGDGSRFSMIINEDTSSNSFPIFVAAERTRNSSGTYTTDGLIYMFASSASTLGGNFVALPATGSYVGIVSSGTPGIPVIPVDANSATQQGSQHSTTTDIALGTMVYFIGKPLYGLSATCISKNDVTVATTFTATVLGATHTFMPLLSYASKYGQNGETQNYLGMLWE